MSLRYDYATFSATITGEGFLRDEAVVTRAGVFEYRSASGIRRELRHPQDVFDSESLASMKLIPITHNHPDGLVNAENCKDIAVGSVGENIRTDGKYVIAPLVVNDSETVQVIQDGKRALSLGYTADIEEVAGEYDGESYDCRQRNIRYNHLSIVDQARAGSKARLNLDSDDAELVTTTPSGGEKETSQQRIDALQQQMDMLLGERDALRSQLATTTARTHQDAKARCKLLQLAETHLDEVVDDWDDAAIKQALIAKVSSADLTGKSETYIDARFDAVMEYLGASIQRQQAFGKPKMNPRENYIHRLGAVNQQENRVQVN